jgi:hypothetical protein
MTTDAQDSGWLEACRDNWEAAGGDVIAAPLKVGALIEWGRVGLRSVHADVIDPKDLGLDSITDAGYSIARTWNTKVLVAIRPVGSCKRWGLTACKLEVRSIDTEARNGTLVGVVGQQLAVRNPATRRRNVLR